MTGDDKFVKVLLVSDDDGHNFIIPEFMKSDWERLFRGTLNTDGTVSYDGLDEFNLKFGAYQIDGGFSSQDIYVTAKWLEDR